MSRAVLEGNKERRGGTPNWDVLEVGVPLPFIGP